MEQAQRNMLLRVARRSIEERVQGRPSSPPGEQEDIAISDCGAFVSLHSADWRIRGCVGCMSSDRPITEVIADMAGAAAQRDPRFPPVRPDELDDLTIEISILSPTEPIASLDDVEIGRDGLLAVSGDHRGVLLPQVASERGWDVETFAEQTCIKANLDPDAWRRKSAKLYKFAAEVFSEKPLPN